MVNQIFKIKYKDAFLKKHDSQCQYNKQAITSRDGVGGGTNLSTTNKKSANETLIGKSTVSESRPNIIAQVNGEQIWITKATFSCLPVEREMMGINENGAVILLRT